MGTLLLIALPASGWAKVAEEAAQACTRFTDQLRGIIY